MKLRLVLILLVLLLPLGSSNIFIKPLKNVYNYGDLIEADTNLVASNSLSGYYTVDLKCGSNISINIYNSFFNLDAGAENPVKVKTELLSPLLENITSSCFLKSSFGSESVNSNSFTLSKQIVVDSKLEFESLKPGDMFYISGTATKKSGVAVDGFVELFIPALNLYKSGIVNKGAFNISLNLPENVKSGTHNFTLEIHNTDRNSKKINFGSYSAKFSISQILKEVKIYVASEEAKPQSDFIFRIDALDQAGESVDKDVSLIVNKPKGVPFIKKVIKSGEDQKISFLLNDEPGYWSIETDVDGIQNRKLFYLTETNTLQTSLINNTLVVTNIGNSPYSGPLEITIGSFVEIKQIKLGPAETQKFTLRAPDGDYSIAISDKAGEVNTLGSAFLTGNAVKVTDFREDVIYTFTNPLIWWLGVILLVLIIVLVQVKVRMQKSNRNPPVSSSTSSSNMNIAPVMPVKEFTPNLRSSIDFSENKKFDMSWAKTSPVSQTSTTSTTSVNSVKTFSQPSAQQQKPSPFTMPSRTVQPQQQKTITPANLFGSQGQGIRERASAIALYLNTTSPLAAETLNNSLHIAQEVGAKIYMDGEYKIILFSPRLTRREDNESSAINIARRIQAMFLEHMKNYRDGLTFGIGVSDGEIISEVEGGKFHFTSTGNLISYAKRLAHASNTKLFVSDSIRRKVMGAVRTEQSPFQGVWEVVKVADRAPSDFIKKFSDRNR